ncbi:MAG: ATP-binding protein [Chloroflexi bacterium]|nr:ATP-binding protein [Chloroflexota bacterium]
MFLNRTHELALLQRWWDGNQPELITIYGRRQVGKTELLVHFIADKPAIYFYADRQLASDHLRAFTEQVITLEDDPVLRVQPFTSWEAALIYVLRLAEQRRIAIILDEFSYAVDADPALPSVIQRLWDGARRSQTQAFIILCTSFTEAVERHFHTDGALYRRRTRELRIVPFTYNDAIQFFPQWSRLDQVQAWGIAGGVPSYLDALRGATLEEAVIEHILDKSAVLYREAETLLAQEVRGVGSALLHGMLQAIAYGASEPNQIAQRVNRPVTALSGALGFLVDYGLLERRSPFTVANPERTRQTRYYIADNYLSFWFRFVLPNRSALEQGQARYVWDTKIAPHLSTYMGPRFEELCRQFIRVHPERWTHHVNELSVWWRASDELEIVGHDTATVVLAAEAKWHNDPVDLDVLQRLQRRVSLLPKVAPDAQLVLFSKSGFTPRVEAARTPYVLLLTLDDLVP